MAAFPETRLRRNRQYSWLRDMVAEASLAVENLIWPVFIIDGNGEPEPIQSMPGVFRHTIKSLIEQAKKASSLGIKAIMLFPAVSADLRTELAEEAYNPDNLICRAIKALKLNVPNLGVICDVALDPYTSHGHDGLLINGIIANDQTISVLCKQAINLAEAGCDIVAPSDMMDGRIGAIRSALDNSGYDKIGILAYSAKYASSFYAPFREAVGSAANLGKASKLTYQMDPRNSEEALREIELDINEGADIIMIKPGMPYLDIIRRAYDKISVPIFAYQVSGEYSMMKAGAVNGWLDWERIIIESLISFKRAGVRAIVTYAAIEVAEILCQN